MADELAVLKMVNPPGTGPIIRNDQGAGAGADRDFIDFEGSSSEVFSVDSSGLPDPGGGDAKRAVIVSYGDVPVDADALEPYLVTFTKAVLITNIYICVDEDSADGSTNKQTISVKRSSDDNEVVGFTTAAANPGISDETWTSLGTVDTDYDDIGAAEYLYCDFTKTSSGLALTGLNFLIEFTLAG